MPSLELATMSKRFQAGTTPSLLTGLAQQYVRFLANRHGALKELHSCNKKYTYSLGTMSWGRPEGLDATSQWQPNSH